MFTKYSDTDIYSGDGVLLYAKGQELTEDVMLKLKRLDIIEKSEPVAFNDEIKIFRCTRDIKDKFYKLNDSILKESSGILSDILFDSKASPWWMFVNALSNYVDWLYTHSIDVALMSLIIAIKLNYKKEMLESLCLGALLHDIGKLLIPKKIIQKPGKLNDTEMTLIKQHCDLGYSMIKELNLQKESADIILQHHERMDGSGYPYGLHENQISDAAKIVMVADVLDAITSYRPYKSAQQLNAAVEELKSDESKYARDIIKTLEDYLTM
jgi:putative nucleotidyltransferase with HDIG domain